MLFLCFLGYPVSQHPHEGACHRCGTKGKLHGQQKGGTKEKGPELVFILFCECKQGRLQGRDGGIFMQFPQMQDTCLLNLWKGEIEFGGLYQALSSV